MSDEPEFTGRCYCGELGYVARGEPLFRAQCHCRECQYFSGGGPNYFMMVPVPGFQWTRGTPVKYTRTDLENPVTRCFCGTCGTHVLTELSHRKYHVVKVGTLDDPAVYHGPTAAIYTIDCQPFHQIPDHVTPFERLPPR